MDFNDDVAQLESSGLSDVRLQYQTLEFGNREFHLRSLRNVQQCPASIEDVEHLGISSATWPLFGVLWPAEEFLSDLMADENVGNRRVLEIGCGLALASLVLKRRGIDVTASDLNPHAGNFLDFNAALNGIDRINFEQAGWQSGESALGRFDLIVGSDLLYDHHNLLPLIDFISGHVRPGGEVLLVDPGRGLTRKFVRLLSNLGFTAQVSDRPYTSANGDTEKYWIMRLTQTG